MALDPSGRLSVVTLLVLGLVSYIFFLPLLTRLFSSLVVVIPAFKGVSARHRQLVAVGQISKAPRRGVDDTPRSSSNTLRV